MDHLRQLLRRIDGRGYPAYRDLKGNYGFKEFTLFVDHVQGDPFAQPSRLRVEIAPEIARWPEDFLQSPQRRVGLSDYLARQFSRAIGRGRRVGGSGGSGKMSVDAGGQEMLQRSACTVSEEGGVEIRFFVGLPARGRRIDGDAATKLLQDHLPRIVKSSLLSATANPVDAAEFALVNEDQDHLRKALSHMGLITFVANGSILPRQSGISDQPLIGDQVVRFQSPPSLEVELEGPNCGKVKGMGLGPGVHLIVGGGFHGKSTLMQAIERGIYNHIPGDGRELVVTDPGAWKVRSEDGRAVTAVNISSFIGDLPGGVTTTRFSTPNASGSTSQAANIIEAIEAGASVLLFDEDTCATNLMIRDRRMQALVAKAHEPITPLVDQVRNLRDRDISLVLVMGGSGDYLDVADVVVAMKEYIPADVTKEAADVRDRIPTGRTPETPRPLEFDIREVMPDSFPEGKKGHPRIRTRDLRTLSYEKDDIMLTALEQLVDPSQTRTLGAVLSYLYRHQRRYSMPDLLRHLHEILESRGLDGIDTRKAADLAAVRPLEIAGMLNRYRHLTLGEHGPADAEEE